ncbi:unnamed protein product, partial [Symbiodinium sp. CCMP2456]
VEVALSLSYESTSSDVGRGSSLDVVVHAPGGATSEMTASHLGTTEVNDAAPTWVSATASGSADVPAAGPSTESTAEVKPAHEDVSLVQRLQPAEAQQLSNLGVRRDTVTALGRFFGGLANVRDGSARGEIEATDVE